MPKWVGLAVVCSLVVVHSASAQADRFELGRRLLEFEKAWDQCTDADAKKRTVAPLNEVVVSFFSFRFGDAGRLLDEARRVLATDKQVPFAVRWAESLVVQPRTRLVDANDSAIEVTLKRFYEVKGDPPPGVKLRLRIGEAPPVEFPIAATPATFTLPLTEIPGPKSADLTIVAEFVVGKDSFARRSLTLSRIENLTKRLEAIDPKRDPIATSRSIEALTAASTHQLLQELLDKRIKETNYPAARLLAEAESAVAAVSRKEAFYGLNRSGEFWLTVPLEKESAPIRIFVPDGLKKDKPVPIVVAMHGAGGSENLFFEGYGDGVTLKRCRERGWIMVGTRAGLGFGFAPPVAAIIDELAKVYPVDPQRVYLVGHSMGAGHVAAVASLTPNRFAAVALLGGGGLMRGDKVKSLPVFIGCGDQDFAFRGAKSLVASLQKAKAERLAFKEYPFIEHITIVRAAADDVFEFFEKATPTQVQSR